MQSPVLCVELNPGIGKREWPRIERELRHLGEGFVHTAKVDTFLRYPKPFPVDIRHNAKIGRRRCAWAAKQAIKAPNEVLVTGGGGFRATLCRGLVAWP
jgi:hypothetical protein